MNTKLENDHGYLESRTWVGTGVEQRIPTETTARAPRRWERSTEERAEKRQNAPQGSGKHPNEKHRQKVAVGTRS